MVGELDKLGAPLAMGRTADVYRWSDQEVVKLFQKWVSTDAVEQEQRLTQAVREMGLPAPSVGDIVMVAGRYGLLLERIEGSTMMHQLEMDFSQAESYAQMLAEMHGSLNAVVADARLPAQREILHEKIASCAALAPADREVVLSVLSDMPTGDSLCHGDFHPHNVIGDQQRHFIIDWVDASRGNPVADVARSSLLFLENIANHPCSPEERRAMKRFHQDYLNHYVRSTSADRDEYEKWLPIMAAARLSEGIGEAQGWLVAQIRRLTA